MLWVRSLPCNVMNAAFRRQWYQKFMCNTHFFPSVLETQGSPSNSCDRWIISVNRIYVKKWQQSVFYLILNPSVEAGRNWCWQELYRIKKQYYWTMTGWLMPCTATAFPASFNYADMLIQHTAGGLIYPPTCSRKVSMRVFYSCGLI